MSQTLDVDVLSPTECIVLWAVAEFERRGRTPVRTSDVRRLCRNCTSRDESLIIGTLSEADVLRSLRHLESIGVVRSIEPDPASPVGKGRPAYLLVGDAGTVIEDVGDRFPTIDDSDEFSAT